MHKLKGSNQQKGNELSQTRDICHCDDFAIIPSSSTIDTESSLNTPQSNQNNKDADENQNKENLQIQMQQKQTRHQNKNFSYFSLLSSNKQIEMQQQTIGKDRFSKTVCSSQNRSITLNKLTKTVPKFKKKILKMDDFMGAPDLNSPWKAHVYWNVTYNYFTIVNSQFVRVIPSVQCNLSRHSWFKVKQKARRKLLSHEQGHYDIGLACAYDFKDRVKKHKFQRTNLQEQIQHIFKQTLNEYLELEKKYDIETDHHKNKENQARWNIFISNILNHYYNKS